LVRWLIDRDADPSKICSAAEGKLGTDPDPFGPFVDYATARLTEDPHL
jgi:hypothetical protein